MYKGDLLSLTWPSRPGEHYTVTFSSGMIDWDRDLKDGIPADDVEATTTRIFDLSEAGIEGEATLYFRVEKEPNPVGSCNWKA